MFCHSPHSSLRTSYGTCPMQNLPVSIVLIMKVAEDEEKDEVGNPKYLKVETGGHHFYTTGELLALAQDLEKMFEKKDLNLNIKFYGKDTLASQVFQQSYYNKNFKVFEGFMKDAA